MYPLVVSLRKKTAVLATRFLTECVITTAGHAYLSFQDESDCVQVFLCEISVFTLMVQSTTKLAY
jgi:hypothetical protein